MIIASASPVRLPVATMSGARNDEVHGDGLGDFANMRHGYDDWRENGRDLASIASSDSCFQSHVDLRPALDCKQAKLILPGLITDDKIWSEPRS